MAEIILTSDNFETEVIGSEIPVLVDFWAPWCGPCKMLGPVISQIAEENEGKVKVGKVNVDEEDELAAQYGIQSIPTVLLFKGGEVVEQSLGFKPKAFFEDLIK
jgi:thioredoxin 1